MLFPPDIDPVVETSNLPVKPDASTVTLKFEFELTVVGPVTLNAFIFNIKAKDKMNANIIYLIRFINPPTAL